MIVKGYACHWNVANGNGEIVLPTSFDESLEFYKSNDLKIPINYNHIENCILGHITNIYKDSIGLYIVAELNEDVDLVKNQVAPLIKDGTLDRFSTEGFISRQDIERVDNKTYIAKKFDLKAVAIVPLPADINAKLSINRRLFKDEVVRPIIRVL
jgi:HK97 family phage prohead protease